MKKRSMFVLLTVCVVVCAVMSCATTSSTPRGSAASIEEAYPDRMAKTVIGMDVAEFKALWPEATQSSVGGGSESYEFIYEHLLKVGFSSGYDYRIFTTFHFTNNKLVRYESTKRVL